MIINDKRQPEPDGDTHLKGGIICGTGEACGVSTGMERRPVDQLPSGHPGPTTEEELAFGGNVGFPTE